MNRLRRLSVAVLLSLVTTALVGPPAVASNHTVNCSGGGTFIINSSVVENGGSCAGTATIPNSVTSIGNQAFSGATALTTVHFEANSTLTSIGPFAFRDTRLLTSITIPNSVTTIGNSAFAVATALTSITIPNSVTSIGLAAFANATALTSITIPNSVTSIGSYAFFNARSLTTMNFDGNAPTVGTSSFDSIGSGAVANINSSAVFPEGEFWNGLRIVRAAAQTPPAGARGGGGGQITDPSSSPVANPDLGQISDPSSSPVANPDLGQISDPSSSPIADSVPAPPAPYAGPLPSDYSDSTPSIGEEVTIRGERLNLVDTCKIDGIEVQISNQSANSFVILIPAGLEPGLKDLVMTGSAGKLTAQGALTIPQPLSVPQPKEEIINEALVSTKLNAGSFNGYVAVYAKGFKGKILSWKIGGKWFKTTMTSDYQVFQRKILNVGRDVLVDIYLGSEQSMTKSVTSR